MKNKVATVAVDNTYFSFDTDYSYSVPDFLEKIEPGCRTLVPFGRGNNERYGIVLSVTDGDTSSLKEIIKIIDKPLSDEMIQLALWLKTRCSRGDTARLKLKAEKWYALKTVLNPIQR